MIIKAEDVNDSIKEWLEDITLTFGEIRADKLIQLRYHYINNLSLPEKVLYDLTFTNEMSTRQVAQKLNIPHTSTYLMIVDLQNKLRDLCSSTYSVSLV
jgi:DNA-directed RNA polymerase specialized sigma subunit